MNALIATEWESYKARVVQGPVSNAQIDQIRIHFYGGAFGAMHALQQIKGVPRKEALKIINSLNRELSLFLAHGFK